MKILAMTVCTVDVYPQHNLKRVGGNTLNFAVQCKRSGVDHAAILGAIGNDENGRLVLNQLAKAGVDIGHLYQLEGKTANNKLYVTEAGERYAHDEDWEGGAYETFRPSEADWAFAQSFDIVSLPILDPNFDEAIARLKNNKFVVDFLHLRDAELLAKTLPYIDIAFFGGDAELVKVLKLVANRFPDKPVVITLGAEGSVTLYYGKSYFKEALPADRVIDTTGCGDAYQAAFTLDWFQHKNISRAMQAGAEAAAKVLTQYGGVCYA